jgi:hypothetical protein
MSLGWTLEDDVVVPLIPTFVIFVMQTQQSTRELVASYAVPQQLFTPQTAWASQHQHAIQLPFQ